MSFATETEELVKDLVQAEYNNACINWGATYNSLHEGYAILLEEVEHCIEQVRDKLDYIWSSIKLNRMEAVKSSVESFELHTKDTIKELAQCGAVLMKIKNTFN